MKRSTKIILLSTGGLILGVGAFFGIRYMIRRRKAKKLANSAQAIANLQSTNPTVPVTAPSTPTTPTSSGSTPTSPTSTGSNTQFITTSGVPVVMTSITTTEPSQPASPTYNANSASFKRLDAKLKSLYRILAILDRRDGKTIFVETDDFKPEKPNAEIGLPTAKIVWREGYNYYKDIEKGFNSEEKDNPTKNYGNLLLDIYKKQRLDYLFPPKTADGKDSVFNPSATWYKEAEKGAIAKGFKTDFWKTN
jgi:hypothetical protein